MTQGGIVAPPPPEMVMHEHLPTSPADDISEPHGSQFGTHYPSMIYGQPQHPQVSDRSKRPRTWWRFSFPSLFL